MTPASAFAQISNVISLGALITWLEVFLAHIHVYNTQNLITTRVSSFSVDAKTALPWFFNS